MMNEPRALGWAAIVDSLFEGIENEACMRCSACPPADGEPLMRHWFKHNGERARKRR